MIIVQLHLGQLLAGLFRLCDEVFGGLLQLPGLDIAVVGIATQLIQRDEQGGQTLMITGGAGRDLGHLSLDVAGQLGDAGELFTDHGDLLGSLVQFAGLTLDVVHYRPALLTDVADHPLHFFRGAAGSPRQTANLVGNHRESPPGLAGTRRLDRGIERKQVGLAGDGLDHIGNLADLVGTGRKAIDQFAAGLGVGTQLLHSFDRLLHFSTPAVAAAAHRLGGFLSLLRAPCAVLLGPRHRLGTTGDLANRRHLRLQLARQLLGTEGDLRRGQCIVTGAP